MGYGCITIKVGGGVGGGDAGGGGLGGGLGGDGAVLPLYRSSMHDSGTFHCVKNRDVPE